MEPQPVSVQQLLGGMVIGMCLTYIVYGITCVQTYIFMTRAKNDPRWLKALVWAIWIIDTIQSAFITRQLYFYTVIAFGNYGKVAMIDWSVPACLYSEDLVVTLSQGFYIRRIWILSNKFRTLTFGLIALLSLRIGSHFTAASYTIADPTWDSFHNGSTGAKLTVIITNCISAVIDGIIAISMIYFLQQHRGGTGRFDNSIRWIMSYTVNSGAIIMIGSIAIAITYHVVKDNLLFTGLVLLMSKLYANALLGTLNARGMMRSKVTQQAGLSPPAVTIARFNIPYSNGPEIEQAGTAFEMAGLSKSGLQVTPDQFHSDCGRSGSDIDLA